jgi:hypothetical protein
MRILLTAGLVLTVLLSFTACEDDGTTTPTSGNTPARLLELIEKYFNGRGINELEGSLSDEFTFYFNPEELGKQVGGYTVPESWTRADFLTAVVNVFDCAYLIEVSFDTSSVGEPGEGDSAYTAEGVPVDMVVMVDTVNAFKTIGTFNFEFRAEYNENNEKEWVVTAWKDFTLPGYSGGRGAEGISFGALLIWFFQL